ncbi:MAG: peptidylprolyl isomerase [Verrucomicrobiota bacterium]
MPWRFLIYGVVILYLFADLYFLKGPLYRRLTAEPAVEPGTVATVNGWPVTEAELERDLHIYCLERNLEPGQLSDDRRTAIRAVVLNRRIDELVVYLYARLESPEVTEDEIDSAFSRFRKQFASEESYTERLAAQGLDEAGLRAWIRGRLMQAKWIEEGIAEAINVTEEEAREWYEQMTDAGLVAEVLRARHLFLTLDDKDPEAVEKEIREHDVAINVGEIPLKDRATEFSDDERSKKRGGDLGYFTANRMPDAFFEAVNQLEVGEMSQPFQTKLGWHIAELLERKPARRASFAEMKDEITALLANNRRIEAVDRLVLQLRNTANLRTYAASNPP